MEAAEVDHAVTTVLVGGVEFVDLRRQGERWLPLRIENLEGILVHHSVSDDDIRADNDLQAIEQIRLFHKNVRKWPGSGYHVAIGDDGTKYFVGHLLTQRAHIAGQNDKYWGIVLLGTYTHVEPPPAQIRGCAEAIEALRKEARIDLPFFGHKDKALPGHGTACPGAQWENYREDIQGELDNMGLTQDEAHRLYAAQASGQAAMPIGAWLRKFWTYICALNGWAPPPELR